MAALGTHGINVTRVEVTCACWKVDIMQVSNSRHNQAINCVTGSGLCAELCSLAGRGDFLVSKAHGG